MANSDCFARVPQVRLFECFTLFTHMGVLKITAGSMLFTMSTWLPLVALLSLGWAIAMNVLAPYYQIEFSPGGLHLPFDGGYTLDLSAGGPFFAPFWAIYGFVEPGALAGARGSAFLSPLFLWLFVGLSLILFVNLLIAMFNETYTSKMQQKDQEWKMSRVRLVRMYMVNPPMPAPFNLAYLVCIELLAAPLLRLVRRGQQRRAKQSAKVEPLDGEAAPSLADKDRFEASLGEMTRARIALDLPPPTVLIGRRHGKKLSVLEAEAVETGARARLLLKDKANGRERDHKAALSQLQRQVVQIEIGIGAHNEVLRASLAQMTHRLKDVEALCAVSAGDRYDARAIKTFHSHAAEEDAMSREGLRLALHDLGLEDITDEHVDSMLAKYDFDGDVRLSLPEFALLVRDVRGYAAPHARSRRPLHSLPARRRSKAMERRPSFRSSEALSQPCPSPQLGPCASH